MIGFLAGAAAFPVAMAFLPWQVAVLVGWNVMALVILTWAIAVILRCDSTATEALSVREDDSRFVADVSQVVACVASLLAVGSSLIKAGSEQGHQCHQRQPCLQVLEPRRLSASSQRPHHAANHVPQKEAA